jgi:hypothetical protein
MFVTQISHYIQLSVLSVVSHNCSVLEHIISRYRGTPVYRVLKFTVVFHVVVLLFAVLQWYY